MNNKHLRRDFFSKTILITLTLLLIGSFTIPARADDKIKLEALAAHNKFRAQHHAPALVWDDQLALYAENYASKCEFRHSHSSYGENLAAGYSLSTAISAWYSEHDKYSYSSPGFSMHTGHFTQMVWKSTRKLGCGYVNCNGKNGLGKFLVCEYSPHGNVESYSYFKANVLPIN